MIITDEMLAVLDQSSGPVGLLECIEVSHPSWPRVLRYIVNGSDPMDQHMRMGRLLPILLLLSILHGVMKRRIWIRKLRQLSVM
ncbi:hypothetical protein BANRA_02767 [Acinetobacter baumannii]|nr:hypothetical protein BANRA_02767 [Acinetobacter baumannii]